MPECSCSNASLAVSATRIGRMPVYYPFPTFAKKPTTQCIGTVVPPVSASVYLGDWYEIHPLITLTLAARPRPRRPPSTSPPTLRYSMPAAAECPPDALELPGARGCTWARRATHHLVHGRQLLGAGFNLSRALDEAQLRQNEKAIEDVLAAHPSRCCDC